MPPAPRYRAYSGSVWRVVEAQHVVSTMKLVDSAEEQDVLETALEATKPPVPEACRHLDYLLSTPFRYGSYPWTSRFRRAGPSPGVFYAAEAAVTALAETVWQRRVFFDAAPGVPLPTVTAAFTAFSVGVRTERSVDLTRPPMDAASDLWTDPDDYSACLDLADRVRSADGGIIRYASVRHPDGAANVAVLRCDAFASHAPDARETWHLMLRPGRAQARREHPAGSVEFVYGETRLAFA